ncbi:MAG: hypothetical protein JSS78_04565 [Bacteroidetes bacterium]|nr:hypothetical protein [Bacteroidota bacterium]
MLPNIGATTSRGINILSWNSQYDGVRSIAVQRSNDSIVSFSTIGYVKNIKKGNQGFVDGHPMPGINWYRLYIVFNSDLTWISNNVKLHVDSMQLLKQPVLPPNDSLQKMLTSIASGTPTNTEGNDLNNYTYVRSQYVFTNPFTGHVNVELPDSTDKHSIFSLSFFDAKNKKILFVPFINEPMVIIDKRNFQRKGLYKFEMRKNRTVIETGYITIY